MIPEIGQRFGPYEILGRLGGGGMGVVFRAWDERLHRTVAVKLLHHDDYRVPGMRERFLQEARAASGLNHANICMVFDIGEQDGDPYLVMELLEGETLKERIERGALTAEEIVRYGEEITDALAVAHAKGIVHRDIKPANIFLMNLPSGRWQTKVLDFGLAKIELGVGGGWGSRTLDLAVAGSTVGTLAYMSPEQARGENLDGRSDLFSLGVVMYEMATRQVPFKGTTSALMFVQLFTQDPEPVRDWNVSIPKELERVILKLMMKDRKERFQTAKELREALSDVAAKVNRGGWLNKGSAAMSLMRSEDVVARQQRMGRRSSGARGEAPLSIGSQETGFSGRSEVASIWPAARLPEDGAARGKEGSSGHRRAANELEKRRLLLARSGSGMTQFEYGLSELDEQEILPQTGAQEVGAGEQGIRRRSFLRVMVAAVTIVIGIVAIALLVRSGQFRPVLLGPGDGLLLTVIQNRTLDKTLDGTVMEGLEIELRESDRLKMLGGEAYNAGLRQIRAESGGVAAKVSEQRVAERVGAKAYLYGEISSSAEQFRISLDVLKTDSNDKLASLEETAGSREEIPAAIGRLAQAVQTVIGGGGVMVRKNIPLEYEGTANVDALHEYVLGEEAMGSGHAEDALTAYQQAVALDPKFAQAQMRLAWLDREQGAEIASAKAAELAREGSAHASDRVRRLATFCYEMNVSGDYGKALKTIQQYVARYPRDAEGMTGLARVLRLQGNLPEALLAAQHGYREDAFDAEAYNEAELALIGLDRYEGALQLAAQAQRLGMPSGGNLLAAEYLGGKTELVAGEVSAIQVGLAGASVPDAEQVMYGEFDGYGLYLDNTGQRVAGTALWKAAANKVGGTPELASTQASLLARGALDRALEESCTVALAMAEEVKDLPKGPVASFNAGMAAGLCGDRPYADRTIAALRQSFPHNTAVAQYLVPELEAAGELGVNEPAKALEALSGVGQYDQVSLVPYLRGLAHAAVGQMPLAIADFQTVLAHRGVAFMLGGNVYPLAEIRVARAFAANGDKTGSAAAYRRFVVLWGGADRRNPLMAEALARGK